MKIDNKPIDSNVRIAGTEAASVEGNVTGNKSRRSQTSAAKDSVSLSSTADLVALASHVDDANRSEKVSRIQAQYRNGSYVIDNKALSNALIDRAFEE